MNTSYDIVIIGLTITSSWGNGHATTYRALVRELEAAGHRVLFLERDVPWYADSRDLPEPPYGATHLYSSLDALKGHWADAVAEADITIVGSYVPDGIEVGDWVLETAGGIAAFYDIDTPVTLQCLREDNCDYLSKRQIAAYDLYLSFAGGRALEILEGTYGSPAARPLYCSVDPHDYYPEAVDKAWDLAYMGTWSEDRQPPLDALMLQAAREWPEGRFCVAGPQYPASLQWPANVERIEHLPPARHRRFYNAQHFTLNITRAAMRRLGWSPSVRLFEAAACGVPIISDYWEGLDDYFALGRDILISRSVEETLHHLRTVPVEERQAIGERARQHVLQHHTAAHRAAELAACIAERQEAMAHPMHA